MEMLTQIQSLHFKADEKLEQFIYDKTDAFQKIFERIESCYVILKLDKNDKDKNKVVEINVSIPGGRLFTRYQAETFELAITRAAEKMKQRLHKRIAKYNSTVDTTVDING